MGKWAFYLILAILPILILITKADKWPFTDSQTLPEGYERIPADIIDVHKLVDKIVPGTSVQYWQYEEWMSNQLTVIRSVGDTVLQKRISSTDADGGFFSNCVPIPVCHSIVSLISGGQVEYVTSEEEMIKFIGNVDNLEEAILIAELKGYGVDPEDVRGGSYRQTANGFILYVVKNNNCPVTSRSVKITLSFDGRFTAENKQIYYETDDCILY